MHFPTPTTLSTLLLTSITLASASTSTSFKLIYRPVPGNTLPIPLKQLAHGTWAVAASTSTPTTLILASDNPATTLTFYQYASGTSTAVATSSKGLRISPGGSATVPSNNVLQIIEGNGTEGVGVGEIPLLGYEGGKFMACSAEKEGGMGDKEVVIRYASEGQRVFEGCMEMELVVRCMPEGAAAGELGEKESVECYMTPFRKL